MRASIVSECSLIQVGQRSCGRGHTPRLPVRANAGISPGDHRAVEPGRCGQVSQREPCRAADRLLAGAQVVEGRLAAQPDAERLQVGLVPGPRAAERDRRVGGGRDLALLVRVQPADQVGPRITRIALDVDAHRLRSQSDRHQAAGVRHRELDAAAHDGTPLATEWAVFAEATDLRKGGDAETPPARIEVRVLHADAASVRFIAPAQPGAYRLFITARDRGGKAATANLPFRVR